MKRLISLVLGFVLLTGLAACAKQTRIELPFASDQVDNIELYRFVVPASAEQKVVSKPEDIQSILKFLTGIDVKETKLEPVAGATVTSFRFNLKDGTDFEIIYASHSAKKGEIKSSYVFDYQTAADVGSIWNNYGEDHQNAGEDRLPVYEK